MDTAFVLGSITEAMMQGSSGSSYFFLFYGAERILGKSGVVGGGCGAHSGRGGEKNRRTNQY